MEQKRGEGYKDFKKGGGQAGSRVRCLKKGRVLEPPYELDVLTTFCPSVLLDKCKT